MFGLLFKTNGKIKDPLEGRVERNTYSTAAWKEY